MGQAALTSRTICHAHVLLLTQYEAEIAFGETGQSRCVVVASVRQRIWLTLLLFIVTSQ